MGGSGPSSGNNFNQPSGPNAPAESIYLYTLHTNNISITNEHSKIVGLAVEHLKLQARLQAYYQPGLEARREFLDSVSDSAPILPFMTAIFIKSQALQASRLF